MRQTQRPDRGRWRGRPESWWWISIVVLVPMVLLTTAAAVVLTVVTRPSSAGEQIDLARTALSVGAGTGGVVALILAFRRQWHVEQAQRDTELSHRAAEHDAVERRITELYGTAAEQLGSDKAPVRLAGLYALERLAQANPSQQQTIVNVLCAYLRMPFTAPTAPAEDAGDAVVERYEARVQEQQVRVAAQSILAANLRPDSATFWPDIRLDLAGATLIDFNLNNCRIAAARLDRAIFTGPARFFDTQFRDGASFSGARFTDRVNFVNAQFGNFTDFTEAKFDQYARFTEANFTAEAQFQFATFADAATFVKVQFEGGEANFDNAHFRDIAEFSQATLRRVRFTDVRFDKSSHFGRATFQGQTIFRGVRFADVTAFDDARFDGETFLGMDAARNASFKNVHFKHGVEFQGARICGDAYFDEAQFKGRARFGGAELLGAAHFWGVQFESDAEFGDVRFAREVDFEHARFAGMASFSKTQFDRAPAFRWARFVEGASFRPDVVFAEATDRFWVRLDVDQDVAGNRVWPLGWEVMAADELLPREEGRWGRLARAQVRP